MWRKMIRYRPAARKAYAHNPRFGQNQRFLAPFFDLLLAFTAPQAVAFDLPLRHLDRLVRFNAHRLVGAG
jgi:hypothetical protein